MSRGLLLIAAVLFVLTCSDDDQGAPADSGGQRDLQAGDVTKKSDTVTKSDAALDTLPSDGAAQKDALAGDVAAGDTSVPDVSSSCVQKISALASLLDLSMKSCTMVVRFDYQTEQARPDLPRADIMSS